MDCHREMTLVIDAAGALPVDARAPFISAVTRSLARHGRSDHAELIKRTAARFLALAEPCMPGDCCERHQGTN